MSLRFASLLGSPGVRTLATLLCSVVFLSRGWTRETGLITTSVGGTAMLNTAVKHLVNRRRPTSMPFRRQSSSPSFPSGHSSGTFAFLGALAYIVCLKQETRIVRFSSIAAASLSTGLVGYSRIARRRHHLGDVVAGYTLGAGWLALLIFLGEKRGRDKRVY